MATPERGSNDDQIACTGPCNGYHDHPGPEPDVKNRGNMLRAAGHGWAKHSLVLVVALRPQGDAERAGRETTARPFRRGPDAWTCPKGTRARVLPQIETVRQPANRSKIAVITPMTASSGCQRICPSASPQTSPTGSPRRSSPRAALLQIPPSRRARRMCSSASGMVPFIPKTSASTPEPKAGAQCVSSARWDLRGGLERAVPTASLPRTSRCACGSWIVRRRVVGNALLHPPGCGRGGNERVESTGASAGPSRGGNDGARSAF